jgi:hypothetical protein
MSRMMCLLGVAALTACTGGSTHAMLPSPTPGAVTSQGPTPSAAPALVACELPFLPTNGYGSWNAVGFLKLPEGTFQRDPGAASSLPPFGVQTSPSFSTHPWWDAPVTRWLPVDLSAVSPDGQTYAYWSDDGLHQVLAANGANSVVYPRPSGVRGGRVLGYHSGELYFVFPTAVKDGAGGSIPNPANQVGVWKLDLASRTATRIFTSDSLGVMSAGALWSAGNVLTRVDLGTGQSSLWFTGPSQFMELLGFDQAGLPIVETFNGTGHLDLWHLEAPGKAIIFYSLDYTGAPHIFGPEMQQGLFVADSHGVWFGAADGVWLYDGTRSSRSRPRRVFPRVRVCRRKSVEGVFQRFAPHCPRHPYLSCGVGSRRIGPSHGVVPDRSRAR